MIDSVYRKDKNYYPQVFLEKYNFVVVEKKMSNLNDDIEIYSDDCYNEVSDEEYSDDSDEEIYNGKIWMKKIKCVNLFLEKIRKNMINLFFKKIRKI